MGIEDAVRSLESQGLSVKRPRKGVFIIKGLTDHFGLDAKADFRKLDANYPKRSGAEPIQWGQPQWVQGDHVALQYRGNALKRRKKRLRAGWKSNSDLGYLRAIELPQLRRKRRVDGVGRLKFDFHTAQCIFFK